MKLKISFTIDTDGLQTYDCKNKNRDHSKPLRAGIP